MGGVGSFFAMRGVGGERLTPPVTVVIGVERYLGRPTRCPKNISP